MFKYKSAIDRLYKKSNYMIQKSINLEDTLYTRLKEMVAKDYGATISDIINVWLVNIAMKEFLDKYNK